MDNQDTPFSIELLQAINDWQIDSTSKRAQALKNVAYNLPERYRSASQLCFRRISLEGKYLMKLGTSYKLSEKISSWTFDLEFTKKFKHGVPPHGYQGVVFEYKPNREEIILNLHALYSDEFFKAFVKANQKDVKNFSKGIGKYGNSQSEIILDVEFLPLNAIRLWGGYSSDESNLALKYYDRIKISLAKRKQFKRLMKKANVKCGPRWLEGEDAVRRVNGKLSYHAERLSNNNAT